MKRETMIVGGIAVVVAVILGFLLYKKSNELTAQTQKTVEAEQQRDSFSAQLKSTKQKLDETILSWRDTEKRLAESQGENARLEQRIALEISAHKATQNQLAQANAKLEDTLAKLKDREKQFNEASEALASKLNAITNRMGELQTTIGDLEKQLASSGAERDRVERELDKTRREKEALFTQWNNLKAIQDRLLEIRREQRTVEVQRQEEQQVAVEKRKKEIGNRGYLVKSGKSTFDAEAWELFRVR